ncbi:hypothetical protein [Glutamicibacter sp. AOP3-A1-12]|uniref:hypothetical protein n=1 Tax=Glutamicibacter sp. AOP3-A1-12 TaxID=3457701 RepID=UPI0040331FD3
MTTKTFKSATRPEERRIKVSTSDKKNLHLTITGDANAGIQLAPSDAPALALAILEAAGLPDVDDDWLGEAVMGLRRHIQIRDKRAAEAKDQAELEAEALELFKASGTYGSDRIFLQFSHLDDHIQKAWLAVASRARELGGRAEK